MKLQNQVHIGPSNSDMNNKKFIVYNSNQATISFLKVTIDLAHLLVVYIMMSWMMNMISDLWLSGRTNV